MAAATALRKVGIPNMIIWEMLKLGGQEQTVAAAAEPAKKLTPSARKAQLKRLRKDLGNQAKREALLRAGLDDLKPTLTMHEDNEAMIQVCKKGQNPL